MYVSTETLAVVNRAVRKTFEQTCVAWQVIPHWDTGDPAQTKVAGGSLTSLEGVDVVGSHVDVPVTLAVASASTPDALLGQVIDKTAELAATVDGAVFPAVRHEIVATAAFATKPVTTDLILDALLEARAKVESAGYRAPSSLVTDLTGIKAIMKLLNGYSVKSALLDASNVNAMHRVANVKNLDANGIPDATDKAWALFFGRRQRVAEGAAASASPGEEPLDIAVSVPPSLEVIGETTTANMIDLRVRVRYAVRVKDVDGVVVIVEP